MWNWCLKELMVGCGLALVVCGGVWQDLTQTMPAAAKTVDLASIPRELEDWSSTDFELPPDAVRIAGINTYLARNYVQAQTGESMTVLIVSGPGGPISVHPPEVCFAGQGYQMESVIGRVKTPAGESDQDHEFSTAIFRGPESSGGTRVQLFWSWSDGALWRTPSNPRLAFARLPRLYKIYISRTLIGKQGREDVKDCLEFMKLLLPEFEKLMSQSSDAPSKPAEPQPADDASENAIVQPPLPVLAQRRNVRRNVLQIARPIFPVTDGEFRL